MPYRRFAPPFIQADVAELDLQAAGTPIGPGTAPNVEPGDAPYGAENEHGSGYASAAAPDVALGEVAVLQLAPGALAFRL